MVYGSIADIFYSWEYLGIFDFVLPFLLVFAIVFGILNATNVLGKNRGVSIIIAVVIGLMSLRYRYFFSDFLSELFPRLGIGLAILLAILILVGLFVADQERKYWMWGLATIGVIIALTVVYQSFDRLGWYFGGYGTDAIGFIVLAILIVGVIIAVGASGGKDGGKSQEEKDKTGSITLSPWRT